MEFIIELLSSVTGVPEDILTKILSLLGLIGSFVITPIGFLWAIYHYKIRRFADQITYSANFFKPDDEGFMKLRIRTPAILPNDDVLPGNILFRYKLRQAIRACTMKDPFIRMSRNDMDVLQPAIINGISSVFSEGIMAQLFGMPVEVRKLRMAITFEKDGGIKSQKIRVLLVSDEDLGRVSDPEFREGVTFERSNHTYRLYTLAEMARQRMDEKNLPECSVRMVRPLFVPLRK